MTTSGSSGPSGHPEERSPPRDSRGLRAYRVAGLAILWAFVVFGAFVVITGLLAGRPTLFVAIIALVFGAIAVMMTILVAKQNRAAHP